jgi:hypothetical protein
MTMSVTSAAAPRAVVRAKRKRRPAGAGAPAPATAPKPVAKAPAAGAATAATPASAAPAPAPAAAPPVAVKSPEYAALDIAGVVADISGGLFGGVTNDLVKPHVNGAVNKLLDPAEHPFLASPYGSVIPGKVAGVAVAEVGNLVGNVVGDALRGVLHGKVPGVEAGKPGLGWTPTPPNKLVAKLVKGVGTSWIKLAVTDMLKPAPQPTPIYAPDVTPIGMKPVPAPPVPRKVLLTDTAALKQGVKDDLLRYAIGAAYDQMVGPLVQRAANVITGRGSEEVAAPKPLTPGKVANGLVDTALGSMLVRSLTFKPLPGKPGSPEAAAGSTPFAATLGTSILNNIVGAAWATVYGRGMGTAIENGVNDLAGIRSKEEKDKATLPALEHFTRAATRGVAVGATTYVLGNALNSTMVNLGASIGGVGGALVAMAGAALIGSIGGSAVDATVGPMLGKLGGQVYSWVTGKPAYEQRMEEAAKQAPAPGPTPGDPVKSPNGNPGTVPAPDAPKAPAAPAPAAGRPKRRRPTGNAAVDRTAPAINVPKAKLAAIAARG